MSFAWIDLRSHAAEIGYWVAERHTRRGVMTSACRALIEHAFGPLELRRIVIRAATGNRPSCAIPERLGFQLEGVEREAELLHGAYVDLARYAKLRHDWAP